MQRGSWPLRPALHLLHPPLHLTHPLLEVTLPASINVPGGIVRAWDPTAAHAASTE
jgi:hypothetical protein